MVCGIVARVLHTLLGETQQGKALQLLLLFPYFKQEFPQVTNKQLHQSEVLPAYYWQSQMTFCFTNVFLFLFSSSTNA